MDILEGGTLRARWTGPCHLVETKTIHLEFPYRSVHKDRQLTDKLPAKLAEFIVEAVEEKLKRQ